MTDLSPAAQAALDAAYSELDYTRPRHVRWLAAGVLRAVADRVVPNEREPKASRIAWKQRLLTRAQLLAIVYELEHTNQ